MTEAILSTAGADTDNFERHDGWWPSGIPEALNIEWRSTIDAVIRLQECGAIPQGQPPGKIRVK